MQIELFQPKPQIVKAVRYDILNGPEIEKWSGGKVMQCGALEPTEKNPSGAFLFFNRGAFNGEELYPGGWVGTHNGDSFFPLDEKNMLDDYFKIA